ncbi:MAG: SipW-dependent-type signal peptide-containing protein [Clostridia bacterium]|nr:SipW-dependent-type signal peptide-containing protein [Clostridia bacterium]
MKKKLLLTSILSLLMCVSLIAGATFALFTSEANVNMTVTSGEVKIEAKISGTQYKTLTEDYTDFTGTKDLDLGGSISVTDDGKVEFNKILPGDGIKFNIEVLNGSNVSVNYRTVITNSATSNADLFSVLAVKLNGEEFTGEAVSNWALLTSGTNGNTVEVEVELPDTVDGEEYMNKTCEFNVLVEAVQGNAPVANVNASGTTKDETIVEDAKGNEAVAPAGVQLNDGEKTLTLQVKELAEEDANTGNFSFGDDATVYAYDVKVPEVAEDNDEEIIVTIKVPANLTNVFMYHGGVAMNRVSDVNNVVNHNDFFYDEAGSITFATKTFSNFTFVNVEKLEGTLVYTADELVAALEKGEDVILASNIKINPANMSNAYGTTGINVKNGQTIDGAGHILDIKGAGGTWDSGINTTGGIIKNITVTGSFRGIFINHNSTHSEKVVLENVIIDGTTYTISCDQGLYQGFEATNCTFNGWTSFAATLGEAVFENCIFGAGSGYNYSRPYASTSYINCTFEAGHTLDPRAEVILYECNYNGVAITEENVETLDFITNLDKVSFGDVVNSGDELQDAINNGEGNIILGGDIDLNEGGLVIP